MFANAAGRPFNQGNVLKRIMKPKLKELGLPPEMASFPAHLDLWIGDWKTFAEFWEAQGVTCERWP